MNSSGLLFTLNLDGSAIIGYEDYNVEFFGGADYEVMYYLDKANFELLIKHLEILNKHSIKKSLISKFGKNSDSNKFESLCQDKKLYLKEIFILDKCKKTVITKLRSNFVIHL